ncbi:TLD domain-containing protein 2 [Orchesella cincta]|uniref:Oxidation resistance protein 1 n=1 Tax=Orchesella cincta TaxID=48709 RepID=A0A1D2N668_ORCCI|nr:TLD domain-containing protein 2 [Orchesella cincta]
MATHISQPIGMNGSDSQKKSLPPPPNNVPFMMVVTDVDEEPSVETEKMNSTEALQKTESHHHGLKFRLTKSKPKVNGKREEPETQLSTWDASEDKNDSTPVQVDSTGKPATRWRRICKCLIGMKIKNKNMPMPNEVSPEISPSNYNFDARKASTYSFDFEALSPNPMSTLRLSPDLRQRKSVSPARSEIDFYLYDMGGMSDILNVHEVRQLSKSFPASAVGSPCILIFSTSEDGYSLHNLYRKMSKLNQDTPIIIVIQDSKGRTFGALLSCTLKTSEHFYGSSDSFLFRCGPPMEVFKWRVGENLFFIHSEENFLRIGAGGGKCGLWLDDNLFHGRTEECATFDSPPLVDEKDFEIKSLECWTFGDV